MESAARVPNPVEVVYIDNAAKRYDADYLDFHRSRMDVAFARTESHEVPTGVSTDAYWSSTPEGRMLSSGEFYQQESDRVFSELETCLASVTSELASIDAHLIEGRPRWDGEAFLRVLQTPFVSIGVSDEECAFAVAVYPNPDNERLLAELSQPREVAPSRDLGRFLAEFDVARGRLFSGLSKEFALLGRRDDGGFEPVSNARIEVMCALGIEAERSLVPVVGIDSPKAGMHQVAPI